MPSLSPAKWSACLALASLAGCICFAPARAQTPPSWPPVPPEELALKDNAFEQGVDVNVIRAWLGHVSLDTTHRYAEINLRTKQAAVAACLPPVDSSAECRPNTGW